MTEVQTCALPISGWKVGCLFSVKASDGSSDVYYGNYDGDGQYYKTEDDTSDNGSAIWFKAVTRPYSGPSAVQQTLWKTAFTYAQGDGNDYDLTLRAIFDMSGEEEREKALSLDPGGAEWDAVDWDEFTWATNQIPPRKRDLHKKANHVQLVFEQIEADAPVTVMQWQISEIGRAHV